MSRDDFLYVGKRDGVYVIVNRSASVDYPEEVGEDEQAITAMTRADQAVLEANRLQAEELTEYGVHIAPDTQEVLGWVKKEEEVEI